MWRSDAAHRPPAFFILLAISLAGTVANTRCALKIRNTFPTDRVAIFGLAFLDSAICAAGNAIFALSHIIANFTRNEAACIVRVQAMMLPVGLGLLIVSEVAVIRCHSVRQAKKQQTISEKRCFRAAMSLIALFCVLNVLLTVRTLMNGGKLSQSVDACVGFARETKPQFDGLRMLLVTVLAALPLVAVIANGITLWNLRKRQVDAVVANPKKVKATYTIPVKAMLVSTGLFFFGPACIFLGYFVGLDIDSSNIVGHVTMLLMDAVRSPLVTALTFSAKVRADLESKKKRQEMIRMHALNERNDRGEDENPGTSTTTSA